MGYKKKWAAWSLLITGFFVTIFAVYYIKSDVDNLAKKEFTHSCNEISSIITRRLHAHAQVLQSGAAFFSVSDTVTREQWKAFIKESKIHLNLPGIQGAGFSLIVPGDKLQQHIQKIRKEGFTEYTIKPGGKREIYTSIVFLEPFSGRNLRAFGFDMFSEPVRREAMERARDKNVAALSGKVMLVQETGTDVQEGNLMYVPVYRKGAETNTLEQRRHAITGWVYSPYRMDDLMTGILEGWELQGNKKNYLHIFDGPECTPQSMLFESHAPEEQSASEKIHFSIQIPVDFNGHRWTLVFTQRAGNMFIDYISVWTVFFCGILISLLLFFLTRALINTENKAKQKAEQLISELKESENRFQTIFEASPVPLVLSRLSDGVVVLANKLLGELFHISTTEIIGKKSPNYYVNPDDRNEILKALVNDGSLINHEIQLKKEDGALFWTLASFQILTFGNEQLILSGFYDITKRKQAEEELRSSKQFIEEIINSMPARVFWKDKNLIYRGCNQAFAEDAGFANPNDIIGKNDFQLVWSEQAELYQSDDKQVIESGCIKLNIEEPQKTPQGNIINLLTSKRPLRDSFGEINGILGVYMDITDQKRAEEEIRLLNSELEQKVEKRTNELSETNLILQKEIEERGQAEDRIRLVYEASPYSIILVDSKGTIRLANHTTE